MFVERKQLPIIEAAKEPQGYGLYIAGGSAVPQSLGAVVEELTEVFGKENFRAYNSFRYYPWPHTLPPYLLQPVILRKVLKNINNIE